MQDLMKQIVDMDRQARKITDSAQKEKLDSEKEIAKNREEIRDKYLEEAKHRIAKLEPKEREAAERAWKETDKKNKQTMQRTNAMYAEKGSEWVAEITKRVTGGIS